MSTRIILRNKQWVRRSLHGPCAKAARAAARFVRYAGPVLRVSFRQGWRLSGECEGEDAYRVRPPNHAGGALDPLQRAIDFFATCCHETCHCQDHFEGRWFRGRGKWRKRPGERAVFDRLYELTGGKARQYEDHKWVLEVDLPRYAQDAILDLAVVIEEIQSETRWR